jgi:putative glycosyltransferase (TIGR04348 family)
VTPYAADANNGNWRTAHRWQQLLQSQCRVIVTTDVSQLGETPQIAVVLHARRSHAALVQLKAKHPNMPAVLVLTGTDLYADLTTSPEAQHSLELADALVVLQEDAIRYVPPAHRRKTHVVFQSARTLTPAVKPRGRIDSVVVGHLRQEKSPETIFQCVELIRNDEAIHITHIGTGLDATIAAEARALTARHSHYRWVGGLAHGLTRAAIKRAHLLLHPSKLEGGANVITEAVTAATPVLASEMSGNVGMLGGNYAGYFPLGDAAALVALLRRARDDANFMSRLSTGIKARAPLFAPQEEKRRLLAVLNHFLH